MTILPIRQRRQQEFAGLQVIGGFIVMGIMVGAAATVAIFLTAGRQVSGDAPIIASLAQATLLGGGTLAAAALVGFLFGVPRLRAQSTAEGAAETYTVPNLEQLSDWLTKMLIGAALVGLANFRGVTHEVQLFAAIGDGSLWGMRIGSMVMLYFAIMGFLSGYVASRMQFADLLERPDFMARAIKALKRLPTTENGLHRAGLTVDDISAIESLRQLSPTGLRRSWERRSWAKAQLLASETDRDSPDIREALVQAERLYVGLVRRFKDTDPDVVLEYQLVLKRLGKSELPATSQTTAPVAEDQLTPRAAIDRMFTSLYQTPPEGFEVAIRIGEELIKRGIQDASIWAYLACAYGQRYAYITQADVDRSAALPGIRERALSCVKQALELDGDRWRPTLRSLWDVHAVRAEGDDDLVCFAGDLQFAALLEPSAVAENMAYGLGPAQRLVRYSGALDLWIASADGIPLGAETPLVPGDTYRLGLRLRPDGAPHPTGGPKAAVEQTIRILEGDERQRAEFELRPEGGDLRFSPDRASVSASLSEATPDCDFTFVAPEDDDEIWVQVLQGRRSIKSVNLPFEVQLAAIAHG